MTGEHAVGGTMFPAGADSPEFLSRRPFLLGAGVAQCLARLSVVNGSADGDSLRSEETLAESRRREHAAARICTARILASMGASNTTVTTHPDRSPKWPHGYVGSITHADKLIAVAAARMSHLRSVGIDLEAIVSCEVGDDIESVCLSQEETRVVLSIGADRCTCLSLSFSAKEALFKCLYPLVQKFFDFRDAQVVDFDPPTGRIFIRLRRDLSLEFRAGVTIDGRCTWDERHVFTSFELATVGELTKC